MSSPGVRGSGKASVKLSHMIEQKETMADRWSKTKLPGRAFGIMIKSLLNSNHFYSDNT